MFIGLSVLFTFKVNFDRNDEQQLCWADQNTEIAVP